ncbi:hypothetical protein DXG01_015181 [Tephrocybe rancida]|nr:hypothetical protein DXG01_015181 [Tephrocybe rancida]
MAPKMSSRDVQLAADMSKDLASTMSADPSLTPKTAMLRITKEMLANNPFVTPTGCPANTLPPELLAHIFLVGTQMEAEADYEEDEEDEEDFDMEEYDLRDGWTDEEDVDPEDLDTSVVAKLRSKGKVVEGADGKMDIDGEDEENDEDEEDERVLPFQVLVSHVCRHWREVAIESPVLWTTLHFTEGAPFEKSKTWIQRAKGTPLDIHLDCTIPVDVHDEEGHINEDEPENSDTAPTVDAQITAIHGHQYATEHAGCLHAPPPFSLSDLGQILDIIVPFVAQWRSLEVTTSVWEYMHALLSRLSECPSAPLLETLEFYHYDEVEDYETFSPAELGEPFLIFNGNAPKLRDVALWGVHLDWDRSLTLLCDLRDLELTYHAEDVRPSYATFTQIIASSPNLRTLGLCLSGPKENEPEDNPWGTDVMEIPSLMDLVFCFHKASYAFALIKKFSLPNVHSLALDFDGEDYTDFVAQLARPMPKSTKSILAGLEHMKISGLPCNKASVELLFRQLAGLKSFNVNCSGEAEEELFKQLLPQKPVAGGSSSPSQRIYCPNLQSITTTGVSGPEMRLFVEARKGAGVPLKRVMMSEEDVVDEKDLKWLRAHVEEVDFFEPSDSEEEFLDEDEELLMMSDDDGMNEA